MNISFLYPQFLWLLALVPLTVGLGLLDSRGRISWQNWIAIGLRAVILFTIIFALAGLQVQLPSKNLTTVFVLDASDSISPEELSRAESIIQQALEGMSKDDRASIVVFGKDSLVDQLNIIKEAGSFEQIHSVPVTTRTNISNALQLAQAILPGDGARRLVLLSDGRENLGHALDQAELAAAGEIELLYVPLGEPAVDTEVLLRQLEAPAEVRQGQDFEVTAVVHSSQPTSATLRLFIDGNLLEERQRNLIAGEMREQFEIPAASILDQSIGGGFKRLHVQIEPDADRRLQNNKASAFTIVYGPPRILIAEGSPGEGDNLANALKSGGMKVDQFAPSEIPTDLAGLSNYEAVVLINVKAEEIPSSTMSALPVLVSDLGRGLLMIGGENSYGAGGYLRTELEESLPVDMDVKNKDLQANLALVLAVDKSGSMGRCHCDNPDLDQEYTPVESGQAKVDIAKEAVMRSSSALGQGDFLGVVAFDAQPRWVLDVAPLVDAFTLENAISSFQAEGGTNVQEGMQAAYDALEDIPAKRKHIILMTDGWVHTGELSDLARRMNEQGITFSVVAAGTGSAEYLQEVAANGGGAYYPAANILEVPDIFLKETVRSAGEYIIEEPFYPLPAMPSTVLRGLASDELPILRGYNGTSAKNTARQELITPRGDPLLATWQYGLGRSAAWTSDMKGQWGQAWLTWDGFGRFSNQLVAWLLPTPKAEGLEGKVELIDEGIRVSLQAQSKDGQPLNFLEVSASLVGPDLNASLLDFQQVGPGSYQTFQEVSEPGTYLIRLGINQEGQTLGSMTLGLVVPYSPEYLTEGQDLRSLEQLAAVTGGGHLSDPLEAFTHNLPAISQARQLWWPLLLLVALLFPLDVAVRRLKLSQRDWLLAQEWVLSHLPQRKQREKEQQPKVLGQLFEARQRAREDVNARINSLSSSKISSTDKQSTTQDVVQPASSQKNTDHPSPEGQGEDTLTRLQEAKKRSHKNS
jgi:Mg-chelatase subunit ChlD